MDGPRSATRPSVRSAEGLAWSERGIGIWAGNPERGAEIVGFSVLARQTQFRAGLLARMGRLPEADAAVQQAFSLLRPRAEPESLCWTLAMLSLLAWLTGGAGDTSAAAGEAVLVAEETGDVGSLVLALEALAVTHLTARRPDEAAAACERALAVGRGKRSGLFAEASVLAHLALARLAVGNPDAAASAAGEAVEVSRRQGARVVECLALLTRAQVRRATGGSSDAIVADLDAALALVKETGTLTYEPFIREELGRLRDDEGELREALRLYPAIGATGHARRLGSELTTWSTSARPAPNTHLGL